MLLPRLWIPAAFEHVPVARDCVCDAARTAGVAEGDIAFVAQHVTDLSSDAVRAYRVGGGDPTVWIAFGIDEKEQDVFTVAVDLDRPGTVDAVVHVPVVAEAPTRPVVTLSVPERCGTGASFGLQMPGGASRVPRARRFMVSLLYALGYDSVAPAAELITSELVTNTVIHTDGGASLSVHITPEVLHVDVCDLSPVPPTLLDPEGAASVGRGLMMVEAIASDWGYTVHDDGKTVWFELLLRTDHLE